MPVNEARAAAEDRGLQIMVSGLLQPFDPEEIVRMIEALHGDVSPELLKLLRGVGGGCSLGVGSPESGWSEVDILSPREIVGRTVEFRNVLTSRDSHASTSIVIFADYFGGGDVCFTRRVAGGKYPVFAGDHDSMREWESDQNPIADNAWSWAMQMFSYFISGGRDFVY